MSLNKIYNIYTYIIILCLLFSSHTFDICLEIVTHDEIRQDVIISILRLI